MHIHYFTFMLCISLGEQVVKSLTNLYMMDLEFVLFIFNFV